MLLLKRIHSFGATTEEMVHLWTIYCRSVLEQSAVVWSSSLTEENKIDIERTQKIFAKIILKNQYSNYNEALLKLNLQSLKDRRKELSLKFAKNCLLSEKFRDLFPENTSQTLLTRHKEKHEIPICHTKRLQKSAQNTMKKQLNEEHRNTFGS